MSDFARELLQSRVTLSDRAKSLGFTCTFEEKWGGRTVFERDGGQLVFPSTRCAAAFLDGIEYARQERDP